LIIARNPGVAVGERSGNPAGLATRLLNFVLFITMLTASVAFIEPSPHDALMIVLFVMCFAARVTVDRKLVPLVLLIVLWLAGGGLSLLQVASDDKALQYFGTSVYLGVAAIMFACLFSNGDMVRLLILRRAYILAALIATAAGYIGFFHLLPGSDVFLAYDRVRATFKDPNVYGPFLIYPLVLLMIGFVFRRFRLLDVVITALLLSGLLLSFSRGAWIHATVSAAVALAILYVAAPDPRMRGRIAVFCLVASIAVAVLVVGLLSIDSVHSLFVERAKALQPYDVGPGGRFTLQKQALKMILDRPNGMGPFEFAETFGEQQHNVYLQGFLVYGWLGGATYLAIVIVTLVTGIRATLVSTPWQSFLVAAYGTFVGEVIEGAIVDTDHWRHFFLLIGLIWGLTVATINRQRATVRPYRLGLAAALPG
jgi:hypothetical protein